MQSRTDELRQLKHDHGLSTEQIARALRKATVTVGQWLAPGMDREIPERDLETLKGMLSDGRLVDGPRWVHLSTMGRPLPTIENVERLLQHCKIDTRMLIASKPMVIIRGDWQYGVSAYDIMSDYSIAKIHSKCAQFELSISIGTLTSYLRDLFDRDIGRDDYQTIAKTLSEIYVGAIQ